MGELRIGAGFEGPRLILLATGVSCERRKLAGLMNGRRDGKWMLYSIAQPETGTRRRCSMRR